MAEEGSGSDNPAYAVPQIARAPVQPVLSQVVVVAPVVWNWTGFYVGAHAGFAFSSANFSDPFGASVFGDTVRSPGFIGGGQIGFNWQPAGSQWVLGVEADADALSSDGEHLLRHLRANHQRDLPGPSADCRHTHRPHRLRLGPR
jgi:opacity protein-like surface antigen